MDPHRQASEDVWTAAQAQHFTALNHTNSGGNCMVTTLQIDNTVYAVGQDDFTIATYTTEGWLGEADESDPPTKTTHDASDALEALTRIADGCQTTHCAHCQRPILVSPSHEPAPRCAICGHTPPRHSQAPTNR